MEGTVMPFDVIDHTADTGIRVWAPDMPSLASEAARGMYEQITDTESLKPIEVRTIAVEGIDATDLMINLLRELLYLFTGEGRLVQHVEVDSMEETVISAYAYCEAFDPERHEIRTEIKAVTYAGGDVQKTPDGFEITVIFDI